MSDWEKLIESGGIKRGELVVFGSGTKGGKSIFEAAHKCLGVERSSEISERFKLYKFNSETGKYKLKIKQY